MKNVLKILGLVGKILVYVLVVARQFVKYGYSVYCFRAG